jgi:hypothetical protein
MDEAIYISLADIMKMKFHLFEGYFEGFMLNMAEL